MFSTWPRLRIPTSRLRRRISDPVYIVSVTLNRFRCDIGLRVSRPRSRRRLRVHEGRPPPSCRHGAPDAVPVRLVATRPKMVVLATPEEDRVVQRHFAYLKSLTERGTVLLVWRTQNPDPTAFGIHILLASSEAEARRLIDDDPAVGEGSRGPSSAPTKTRPSPRPGTSRPPA